MVDALKNTDNLNAISAKRYLVLFQNIHHMKTKNIYDLVNSSLMKWFERFYITTNFLDEDSNG